MTTPLVPSHPPNVAPSFEPPTPQPLGPPLSSPQPQGWPSFGFPSASQHVAQPDRSVAARWTPRLAERHFTPISEVFLHNLQRLRPNPGARGLNPTEALVIIQLMSHKWDSRAPFPALTTIAERLGLQVRSVRAAVKRLEDLGYLRREPSTYGGPNRYHLDGLFTALEALVEEDAKLAAQPTTTEAA